MKFDFDLESVHIIAFPIGSECEDPFEDPRLLTTILLKRKNMGILSDQRWLKVFKKAIERKDNAAIHFMFDMVLVNIEVNNQTSFEKFKETFSSMLGNGRVNSMLEALEAKGREEGLEKGMKRGQMETWCVIIRQLLERGLPLSSLPKVMGLSEAKISKLLSSNAEEDEPAPSIEQACCLHEKFVLKGQEQGFVQGRAQGSLEAKQMIARHLLQQEWQASEVAHFLELPEELVAQLHSYDSV